MTTTKIIQVTTVHAGWTRMLVATIDNGSGATFTREIEDHGQAVGVLPYNPDSRCALVVRQFRAPVHYAEPGSELIIEAIAGIQESDDSEACARREAMEETGVRLESLEHVARCWTMPGISTERINLYLARYSATDRIATGGGLDDEHENITVVEMPLDDLAAQADAATAIDMKLLALVQALRLRQPKLFERR